MIKPVNKHLLLEVYKEDSKEKTQGGIILSTAPAPRVVSSKVLAVASDSEVDVKESDEVLYHRTMAIPIEIKGNKYIMIKSTDVIGIM